MKLDVAVVFVLPMLAFADLPCAGTASQGWDCATQKKFWYTSQGSVIMDADWFAALERSGSTDRFTDALKDYGFLSPPTPVEGAAKLPIGFAYTQYDGRQRVGMTCAACHTARITWNGKSMLVDGGPAMIDFEKFLGDVVASLTATLDDGGKFERFRQALTPPPDAASLRARVKTVRDEYRAWLRSADHKVEYGSGRVDAFGYIFNRVTRPTAPAKAPVSYPHLWTTPRLTKVQWNASAPNFPPGPLFRNIGEALGVFAILDVETPRLLGYKSSLDIVGLDTLEEWISTLRAPKWPTQWGPEWAITDTTAGKNLFEANCSSCHQILTSDGTGTNPDIAVRELKLNASETEADTAYSISTDPTMANSYRARAIAQPARFGSGQLLPRPLLLPLNPRAGDVLFNGIANSWIAGFPLSGFNALQLLTQPLQAAEAVGEAISPSAKYKARPLNGIWATAPFLHNGSVPTITELLTEPLQRNQIFCAGSREFDPANVGFKTEYPKSASDGCSAGQFLFDTKLEGNHNLGHAYGTKLDANAKRELLEYLKSI